MGVIAAFITPIGKPVMIEWKSEKKQSIDDNNVNKNNHILFALCQVLL